MSVGAAHAKRVDAHQLSAVFGPQQRLSRHDELGLFK